MKLAEPRDPTLPSTEPSARLPDSVEQSPPGITVDRGGTEPPASEISSLTRFLVAPPDALFRLNSVVCQVWLLQFHQQTPHTSGPTTCRAPPPVSTRSMR